MAKKISQLTQATEVKSDDVTVIVQDGETKKLPLNMMVTKQDIENKKVAGLAKLDEIEATYENDTYTPTITVENKSSVKTGEGDEVDYSANVMDGHVKSAILSGNTLVNLAKTTSHNFAQGRTPVQNLSYSLKTGITYTIIINVISVDAPNGIYIRLAKNNDNYTQLNMTLKSTGLHKTTITPAIDFNQFAPYVQLSDYNSGLYASYNQLMIVEGDYTNIDIPYFEGMQSVKMPVLTTTGKNLFDGFIEKGVYAATSLDKANDSSGTRYIINEPFTVEKIQYAISIADDYQIFVRCFKNRVLIKDGAWVNQVTFDNTNGNYDKITIVIRKMDNSIIDENILFKLQIEQGKVATSYEPYKSNILSTSEDVTLRGIGDVRDTLDCLTGEVTERISEVVLAGSENWNINYQGNSDLITFSLNQFPTNIAEHSFNNCKNFLISDSLPIVTDYQNNKGILSHRIGGNHWVVITVNRSDLISEDVVGFKHFLSTNPVTIQYQLATESIKTVDLMPSGTHPSTTPYCWKNGHIQLSSSGLLPNLEYSVVTSRAGQINQNATMIVKNDKRIFDLEILLAGGLVNTTYQALTLQNQVETGLSKVSLNSETEPDYLLYHMIMKLIEEKAYKLDDLTEKVSVFYLYEKLSDEQFETIYSALYPFVEDEIVEEPVVEELPEVVEDEVIM